jgi:8-oxo-dGTP diphosphatase
VSDFETSSARPLLAAGLLIRDPENRILLVRPTYKDGWDIPGGYVEPGESPAQAAAREVIEEVGAAILPSRLLVVDWAPHPAQGDKLLFVFDGGMIADASSLRPDDKEIAEAAFYAISDLGGRMPDRLARRLQLAAEAAASTSGNVYAEHGRWCQGDSPGAPGRLA